MEINQKIGGYTLIKELGAGTSARVWRARKETFLHVEEVAMKFFFSGNSRGLDLEKIRREIAVWKAVSECENVIRFIDADKDRNYIYIVSQYADGGSLQDYLNDQGGTVMPFKDAVSIVEEILNALEEIHNAGYVHRDIKPANILIRKGKHCLSDFGISRKMHSHTTGGVGTFAYMPPEAFGSSYHPSPKTDLWSVGVLLYELLTGELPFPSENPSYSIQNDEPTPLQGDIPSFLNDAVARALTKDLATRFQSASDFRSALQGGISTEKNKRETILDAEFIRPEPQNLSSKNTTRGTGRLGPRILWIAVPLILVAGAISAWQLAEGRNGEAIAPGSSKDSENSNRLKVPENNAIQESVVKDDTSSRVPHKPANVIKSLLQSSSAASNSSDSTGHRPEGTYDSRKKAPESSAFKDPTKVTRNSVSRPPPSKMTSPIEQPCPEKDFDCLVKKARKQ